MWNAQPLGAGVGVKGLEDMNHFQKSAKPEAKWGARYKRPQTSLAVIIRKKMLQQVHRFNVDRLHRGAAEDRPALREARLGGSGCAFVAGQVDRLGRSACALLGLWKASATRVSRPSVLACIRILSPNAPSKPVCVPCLVAPLNFIV